MTPAVSMVIATYNRRAMLQDAVASVRRAAGRLPYQIVAVDGGSTDGTLEWLELQSDVTVVRQSLPLTGAVAAYNLGFKEAVESGAPLIGYINDDDMIVDAAQPVLERAVDIFAAHPQVGAVAFQFNIWRIASVDGKLSTGPRINCGIGVDSWAGKPYVNKGILRREAGMSAARAMGDPSGCAWWNPDCRTYAADTELGCWLWRLGWSVYHDATMQVRDRSPEAMDAMRAENERRYHARVDGDGQRFYTRWSDGARLNYDRADAERYGGLIR